MLLDHAEYHRQSEAGAFARLLRREKRLENVREMFRRDSAAGVVDAQADVAPWTGVRDQRGFLFREVLLTRFNQQPSAARHGVARVDHQIHQHLVEHPRVGAGQQRTRPEVQQQAHVLAQDAPEHLCQVRHDLIQVQQARLHHMPPTEGHQLPGQVCGPFGAPLQLANQLPRSWRQVFFRAGQVRLHHHRRQNIVEIMRHSPRQLADGFHLLRLPELFLQLLLLGNVLGKHDDPTNRAIRLPPRLDFPPEPVCPAVGPQKWILIAFLHRTRQTSLVNLDPSLRDFRKDFVMTAPHEGLIPQPVIFAPAMARHQISHVSVQHRDGRRTVLRVESKLFLPFPERCLCPLAFGRFQRHSPHPHRLPVVAVGKLPHALNPPQAAVGPDHPEFPPDRLAGRHAPLHFRLQSG